MNSQECQMSCIILCLQHECKYTCIIINAITQLIIIINFDLLCTHTLPYHKRLLHSMCLFSSPPLHSYFINAASIVNRSGLGFISTAMDRQLIYICTFAAFTSANAASFVPVILIVRYLDVRVNVYAQYHSDYFLLIKIIQRIVLVQVIHKMLDQINWLN